MFNMNTAINQQAPFLLLVANSWAEKFSSVIPGQGSRGRHCSESTNISVPWNVGHTLQTGVESCFPTWQAQVRPPFSPFQKVSGTITSSRLESQQGLSEATCTEACYWTQEQVLRPLRRGASHMAEYQCTVSCYAMLYPQVITRTTAYSLIKWQFVERRIVIEKKPDQAPGPRAQRCTVAMAAVHLNAEGPALELWPPTAVGCQGWNMSMTLWSWLAG